MNMGPIANIATEKFLSMCLRISLSRIFLSDPSLLIGHMTRALYHVTYEWFIFGISEPDLSIHYPLFMGLR